MKRTFIEATLFKKQLDQLSEEGLLQKIQNLILKDTETGDLVKGTGGVRKFRVGLKGKGKSGGIRVFYFDIPTKSQCFLLFILEKSDSENISDSEKNILKAIVEKLKK